MRRSTFHVWLLIGLVLARLLAGASVHAAPHAEHVQAMPVELASEEGAPCPDHANDQAADAHESSPASSQDCCADGGCDCPCAHVSACIPATPLVGRLMLAQMGASAPTWPLPPERLTPLLRPPA